LNMRTKKIIVFKRIEILLLIFLSLGLIYQFYMEETFQIYDQTLRFHVRAASDVKEEQQLKLKVRDAVLASLRETVAAAENVQNLESMLEEQLSDMKATAETTLHRYGSDKKVTVALTTERFPIRRYGSVVFPAGEYQALRVDIGRAQGHNWWCAIYPSLCYSGEKTLELSEKGKIDLDKNLSKKEKDMLAGKKIKFRFKIFEFLSTTLRK
ncbi:MAG: stage II sporulation protein R, partial [Oliverpabstia sp.]